MEIVLTGAAGFIGSHVAERLVRDGHCVTGVDSLVTGRRSNVSWLEATGRFRLIEADVIQPLTLDHEAADWILHFASPASPPKYLARPIDTLRVNAEGTFHLLELAALSGASFFLASTSEVYGDPLLHPQAEGYWGHVNPTGPRSAYDEGKRYAEAMASAYHRERGVPIRIVRIFNTYGPRMDADDGRVVTNFLVQALGRQPLTIYGDGTQTRSFQYVDDLVEGIIRMMGCDYPSPINLGNPEEVTILELAQIVNELTGNNHALHFEPLPVDDPRQRRPDIDLAQRLLGWEPRIALVVGLGRTLAALGERLLVGAR